MNLPARKYSHHAAIPPPPSLYPQIRQLLRKAETETDKAQILNLSLYPNLFSTLEASVRHPQLAQHVAHLFSLLSVEHEAADLLSQPPFVILLDAMLEIPPPHPTIRHGARAVRNITAHSAEFAHALARHSGVIRRLIIILRQASQQPDADSSEIAAAVANFARGGLQCQAYARKHGSLSALAEAAMSAGDATRFHSCRALAEYSLQHKWLVQLVSEGCVGIMIRVLERDADEEIVSEATRFLGNLATSKVGREAALDCGALERVVTRVLTLADNSQLIDLRADLLRTATNLCVNSKEAAGKLIAYGGLSAFIDAHTLVNYPNVQTEAFRGLLIVAQATHATRAAVLRDIGIKIRQDASVGRCVASLYDLLRRIKVEASAERAEDFPQTIADLGARSKQYLFRAGPLASGDANEDDDSSANSVPEIKSPAAAAFRQSGRLLSVQRPVLHRERLERDRQKRVMYMGTPSPVGMSEVSATDSANTPISPGFQNYHQHSPSPPAPYQQKRYHPPTPYRPPTPQQRRDANQGIGIESYERDCGSDGKIVNNGRALEPRAVSEPGMNNAQQNHVPNGQQQIQQHNSLQQHVDAIPTCKVIEASRRDEDSAGQWIRAVWLAVCSAVSRPHNGGQHSPAPPAPRRDVPNGHLSEDNLDDVYEIGVPLGRGGFATVFLAKNLRTGELVAVKRFHPPSGASHEVKRKAEVSLRRAIKEQRIWDGLAHKNIVSYKGCFFGEQGELNLVAEYIPGWSLADHLSQISKFPEHMVACITLQIVAGLDYLHKNGVTHRDVKPANILVNPDGVIKITDFGVSSAVDVPTMTGNTLVGTPWYIAPEMIEGRPYGKSVDIWSLGCTVIELATGKRPYHHLRPHIAMFRMTQDRMPPIPKKMSPMLRDFLKTCWVWDPAQRPTPAHLRRHPFLTAVSKPEVTNLKNMARKAG